MAEDHNELEIEYVGDGENTRKCISCGNTFNTKEALISHYERNTEHRTVSFDVSGGANEQTSAPAEGWVEYDEVLREFRHLGGEVDESDIDVEYDEETSLVMIEVDGRVAHTLDASDYHITEEAVWQWDEPYILVELQRA